VFVRDEITVAEPVARVLFRLQNYLQGGGSALVASDTTKDQDALMIRAGISMASKQVAVRTLPPVVKGLGAEIALSWSATGVTRDLYPSLEATISIEAIDEASTRIRIVGSYLPPLGDVGVVLDRLVGHRIAAATLRSFLVRVEQHVLDAPPQTSPARSAHILPTTAAQLDNP
jgi:hypothetical protein